MQNDYCELSFMMCVQSYNKVNQTRQTPSVDLKIPRSYTWVIAGIQPLTLQELFNAIMPE